jgi:hypothetical protein
MRSKTSWLLIPLMLSGCAIGSNGTRLKPAPVVTGNFCAVYKPVYFSRNDTEDTKKAVTVNNASWVELCEAKTQ